MKARLICFAALAALCAPAAAQVRHDAKLERAAMEIIARKIGDIRPTLPVDRPLKRIDRRSIPHVEAMPAPAPLHENWQILGGDAEMRSSQAGSIQLYSDGTQMTPAERRRASSKTVSRIINF